MRIKKLELKNFRGFEELTIDFPEGESGLAVFVGVNGSGKTSVLDVLAALFREIVPQKERKKTFKAQFTAEDVRIGGKEISIKLVGELQGKPFTLNESSKWKGFNNTMRIVNNEIVQVPVLAYYKTTREMVQNGDGISRIELEGREFAYSNAFSTKIDDFQDLLEWFRYQEDLENQEKIDRKNFDYTNPGLQVVREAVSKFLNCFDAKFDNLKVRRIAPAMLDFREAAKQWNLVISKNGLELKIAQLSSGERALVALVADIARRAAIANPQLPNPLTSEGVTLIDEVELHLHPVWQRNVAGALYSTFPNIQFILTTHSPQVLSTLKKKNVFILEDFKLVKDTPHTYGRDSNSILYDIFGVEKRPSEAKKEINKLYRLMDDPDRVKETESMLHELEEKYGYYDEEMVRARAHFQTMNEA